MYSNLGIRNIIGIDFDHIEITNLHRQVLYDQNDLGALKIKGCEKKIKEAGSKVNFIGHYPFSYFPSKKALAYPAGMIAQPAMDKNTPCLILGGSWVGPLTIPHQTSCYFHAINVLELATCCSIAVHEACRFLSRCDDSQVLNGVIQLDMFSFSNSQYLPLEHNSFEAIL